VRPSCVLREQRPIKSCETKQRSKLPQMTVEYEAHRRRRVDSNPAEARDLNRVKHGIHRDLVIVAHAMREICRQSIHHDHVDFGMWDAERLDDVLHGRGTAERVCEAAVAELPWQEVIELSVKPKPRHDITPGFG